MCIRDRYLDESGGIVELAKALIRFSGPKYDLVAIALVGYILSIPVGLLASVAIISPMLKPMSKLTGKPLAAYTTAFIVSSLLTACTVVPTSGPVPVSYTHLYVKTPKNVFSVGHLLQVD